MTKNILPNQQTVRFTSDRLFRDRGKSERCRHPFSPFSSLGLMLCFTFASQMNGMHPRGLRTHSKLYNCVFMGERSQDAGGPYRESWSMYAQELQVWLTFSRHHNMLPS